MRQTQKRFITMAAAAMLSMAGARAAQATLLVYDSFSQSAGTNLGGTTPDTANPNTSLKAWVPLAGTPPGDDQISSPGLTFPGSYSNAPGVSGNALNTSASTADSIVLNSSNPTFNDNDGNLPTVYYSMLVNVPSTAGLGNAGSVGNTSTSNQALFAALSDGTGDSSGMGTQTAGLYLTKGVSGGFELGIGAGSQNPTPVAFSGDLNVGQTYFVVASFVAGSSDVDSLWINPVLGLSSAPAALASVTGGEGGGANVNEVNRFAFTSNNSGDPTAGVTVDELRIGTTWADVTPTAPVPEPASLMLLGLSAIGLLMAAWRRKKT